MRSPHRQAVDAFLTSAWPALPASATVLDVGAGRHRGDWRIPQRRSVAMDLAGADLAYRGDCLALPHPAGTFDAVQAVEMLYLVADPVAAFREMHRVLRPHGWLVVTVPFLHPPMEFGDQGRYPSAQWVQWLWHAGFSLVEVRALGGLWLGLCQLLHRSPHRWIARLGRWLARFGLHSRHSDWWPLAWGIIARV